MNQRIQALVAQASYKIIETNEAPIITQEFDKELFAQLIVQECEKVIRAEIAVTDISGEVEKAWEMGMECGVGLIKEHFGVEE